MIKRGEKEGPLKKRVEGLDPCLSCVLCMNHLYINFFITRFTNPSVSSDMCGVFRPPSRMQDLLLLPSSCVETDLRPFKMVWNVVRG